jgi:V/A-type H+-transporting ATPase subunit I
LSLLSKISLNRPDIALKTYIIVPKEKVESITEELVRKGFFEPLPPQEATKALEVVKKRYELAEKALGLFRELNSLVKKSVEIEVKELPWDTDSALEKLVTEFEELKKVVNSLLGEVERIKWRLEKLRALKTVALELSEKGLLDESILDYEGVYIVSKILYGDIKEVEATIAKSLKTLLYRSIGGDKAVALALFERRFYEEIKPLIEKLHIPVRDLLGGKGDLSLFLIDETIKRTEVELYSVESKLEELLESKLYELALLKVLAETINSEVGVLGKALSSKYMSVIVGWSLKSRINELEEVVRANSGYVVYKEDPEPPVDFNNLKPFKPFEIITEVMGLPSPSEWDPTPILTYLYLIFFSLMFSDIGYSIGLIIGARLVLPYFVDNKETLRKLVSIATYAGIAGCITGFLANNFFGSLLGSYIGLVVPRILPSIPRGLSDPIAMKSAVLGYITLTLILGYYVVLFAHVLGAWKNAVIRNKFGFIYEVLTILIAVFGPAAIQASIGLNTDIWGLSKFLGLRVVMYSTILLITLYAILRSVFDRPFGAILWLFDIIGILADILSFVRIAGIALGSGMLAEIFNGLILNVFSSLNSLSLLLGILVGALISTILHVVNLGFSSLSPFIHSLRLVIYEFSSKFYEGSGRRISPATTPLLRVKVGTIG